MTASERAEFVLKTLNRLYPNPEIPLNHTDEYTLLIAVLLSAQCTDERVNKVTPALFARANTPEQMVQLSVEEIKELIRPCGLSPQKSKAIHTLSHILIEKYAGKVPQTFEELEELPGVGHKTASVVMSQAFGVPAFPVDTHIHRLAQRWGFSKSQSVVATERALKKAFAEKHWNKLHLQIIYYGREHCKARECYGLECMICKKLHPDRKKKIATKK
jgi:endonuclease III